MTQDNVKERSGLRNNRQSKIIEAVSLERTYDGLDNQISLSDNNVIKLIPMVIARINTIGESRSPILVLTISASKKYPTNKYDIDWEKTDTMNNMSVLSSPLILEWLRYCNDVLLAIKSPNTSIATLNME